MAQIYEFINNSQSKFYLYLKVAGNILILILLLNFIHDRGDVSYKVMLIATIASVFSTLFWGTIFANRDFEKNVAKVLVFFDLLIIFLFIYPVAYNNAIFIILPALLLISIVFLFQKEDLSIILIPFFLVFTVTSFIYGILNVLENPVQTYTAHLMLYGILFSVLMITITAIKNLEHERGDLNKQKEFLNKKYEKLEREFSLSKQHMEVLNKDVRKKDVEIKNILTLSGQLNIQDDSQNVLGSFLLTAIGQIGSSHAALLTKPQKEQNFINVLVQKGLRGYDLSKIRIYLHSNLAQVLNAIRDPILVSQIPREGLYDDEIKILNKFAKDLICPVFVRNNLTGLFIIGHKVSGLAFNQEDINLVSIIANQAAFIFEQTQMSNDYQEYYTKTLRAMIRSLEAKYSYARGHIMRTANYVNIVAQKIGLPHNEIKDLSYGALLHDIGKIAVKDKYLLNKLKFSDSDIALKEKILQHTIEGSKILKSAGFNDVIIDMALHHHEFYDGSGYPHKIGEKELSIGSKILTVCNAYDAMTSDRPHRKALSDNTAKEYLRYYSGNQFDPDIAKAFLYEIENNKKMQRYH